jgi:hypothetical protein
MFGSWPNGRRAPERLAILVSSARVGAIGGGRVDQSGLPAGPGALTGVTAWSWACVGHREQRRGISRVCVWWQAQARYSAGCSPERPRVRPRSVRARFGSRVGQICVRVLSPVAARRVGSLSGCRMGLAGDLLEGRTGPGCGARTAAPGSKAQRVCRLGGPWWFLHAHRAVCASGPFRGGCDGHLTRRRWRLPDAAVNDGVLVGISRTNTPWFVDRAAS